MLNERLHDYLDYKKIKIILRGGKTCTGFPLAVDYSDETESGEDEIDIEVATGGPIYGFAQSEIEKIEIVEE